MSNYINNYDVYTSGMEKSLEDKLFFTKIINDYDYLLDYGCANGALIREFLKNVKHKKCVGYDVDKIMVMKAQFLMDYTRSFYINDFNAALDHVIPERTVLNLSSVIHEVYSYSKNDEEIGLFWHNVTCSGFKYIVIRDFCLSESAKRNSNIIDLMKLKMKCDKKQLREFEGVWGSVRKNQNLVHYLMKYRYLENWNREVKENYFPVSAEKIKDSFRKSYYEPIYMQEYTLPFTRDKVKEDFGIKLKDFTHVKMIFERKY